MATRSRHRELLPSAKEDKKINLVFDGLSFRRFVDLQVPMTPKALLIAITAAVALEARQSR